MSFSELDGKRIAVLMGRKGERAILYGMARYETDPDLGPCLRIALSAQPGNPHLLFPESSGGYDFQPDHEYGCDYTLKLPPKGEGAASET